MAVYSCIECDYCYSNETFRGGEYICVNAESEYFTEFIDPCNEDEDLNCLVKFGKPRWELEEDEELEEELEENE